MEQTQQIKRFKDLNTKMPTIKGMEGSKIDINKLFGREIVVHGYSLSPSKLPGKEGTKCLTLQISIGGSKHVVFSGSKYLMDQLDGATEDFFPFSTTIVKKDNDSHQFT